MNRSLFAFLPLLAIGCVTPTSGEYIFEETASTSDCQKSESETSNEPITVTVSEDKSTVTIADIEYPLEGTSFEDVVMDEETDYNESGIDAIVSFYGDFGGTWVSNSKITGTSSFAATCEGPACADLEAQGAEFCSASSDWEGNLQE